VAHTAGADGLSVIEFQAPFGDSPPLHIHHVEDELFHVLKGEFRFTIGGEEMRAGPGEVILAPKGVPHTSSGRIHRWRSLSDRDHARRF